MSVPDTRRSEPYLQPEHPYKSHHACLCWLKGKTLATAKSHFAKRLGCAPTNSEARHGLRWDHLLRVEAPERVVVNQPYMWTARLKVWATDEAAYLAEQGLDWELVSMTPLYNGQGPSYCIAVYSADLRPHGTIDSITTDWIERTNPAHFR